MSDLAGFQESFAKAVLADSPLDSFSIQHGFAVYRNTSARGAVEALRAAYPTVDMLVGDEMFSQVALDYRTEKPPAGPVLSDYGADFPDFLARQLWTRELPYLADVARLDWLWLGAFLAPDRMPATRLLDENNPRRIGLHPAARFAWLATPAMTIWQAHRDPWGVAELAPYWREEGALFTRRGPSVRAELIGPECHHLLLACAGGMSVDDCLATVSAAFPEADVTDLLDRCFMSGALIIF
jgi:hypothetical protein